MSLMINKWQIKHTAKVIRKVGKRYTPELNVKTTIYKNFSALTKDEGFYGDIRIHFAGMKKQVETISSRKWKWKIGFNKREFRKKTLRLNKLIKDVHSYNSKQIPWQEIHEASTLLSSFLWEETRKLYDKQNIESLKEDIRSLEHNLRELSKEVNYFKDYSISNEATLSNSPYLLVTGSSGIGKTHLFCDLLQDRTNLSLTTIMYLGQDFKSGNLWKNLSSLGYEFSEKDFKDGYLKRLNDIGKTNQCRSLIIIDALNESAETYWKNRLPLLIKEVRKFENVALIVSVRNGFLQSCVSRTTENQFTNIEHFGFKFNQWEAINRFFSVHNIPLPEVPVINTEFDVPLFLLLFCKSFQNQKRSFRGNSGSTHIFESYVKTVGRSISKKFNLKSSKQIWDSIIKPLAIQVATSGFVNYDIERKEVESLISLKYPRINKEDFILSLEKEFILDKLPKYDSKGKIADYTYRFSYQKFSDHLIVRYLLNEYVGDKKSRKNYHRHFKKYGKIGKIVSSNRNSGLVKALAIQVPERLNGTELVDLVPWAKDMDYVQAATIESITWRNVNAFRLGKSSRPANLLKYIKEYISQDLGAYHEFLNSMIIVSAVPDHPFNAEVLHKHLLHLDLNIRDYQWTRFLTYQYGETSAVDRILNWVIYEKQVIKINNDSKKLLALVLTWFFTSNNRELRDKTTKALVHLLQKDLPVVRGLIDEFIDIDDLYVLDRLFASTYGIVLRSSKRSDIKEICIQLTRLLKEHKIPQHILIRDYIQGIFEYAKLINVWNKDVDYYTLFTPRNDLRSVPSEKVLEGKIYPKKFSWDRASDDERGIVGIWRSIDEYGDFTRYIVEPALRYWSSLKSTEKTPPDEEQLDILFRDCLSPRQAALLQKQELLSKEISYQSILELQSSEKIKTKELGKELDHITNELNNSLNNKQKSIRKYVSKEKKKYPYKFDLGLARRWLLNEVFIEMKYSHKLHGRIDSFIASRSLGRSDTKNERIGKKYQWIALHKLVACISDNFKFRGNVYGDKLSFSEFRGAWELGMRDIDPSCILMDQRFDEEGVDWWLAENPEISRDEDDTWFNSKDNIPNLSDQLIVKDKYGKEWFILHTILNWKKDNPPEKKESLPPRELIMFVNCYLVDESTQHKIYNWAINIDFVGGWMPERMNGFTDAFLHEFPSMSAYLDWNGYSRGPWIKEISRKKLPGRILLMHEKYTLAASGRDFSSSMLPDVSLPSKWLVDELNLLQSSRDSFFKTSTGRIIFKDESTNLGKKSVLLVDKDYLEGYLSRNNYSLLWTIVGEKRVIKDIGVSDFAEISGAYIFDKEKKLKVVGSIKVRNRNKIK